MTQSHPPVTIIGMGLSRNDLTAKHMEMICKADILIAGTRHLAAFQDHPGIQKVITGDIQELITSIKQHMDAHRIVVLASGDPLLFGIGSTLIDALGSDRIEVFPNISSIAAAFSRIKTPWQDARIISLHGKQSEDSLFHAVQQASLIAVLTDPVRNPAWIARSLLRYRQDNIRMCVLERLGTPEEKVSWFSLEQAAALEFEVPNLVILKHTADLSLQTDLFLGLPEEAYAHENSLITKSEVRAVTLSKLKLMPCHTLWDLGAGSGSIGIEASLLMPAGTIIAVEKHPERIRDIERNRQRFGVRNMQIRQAELPNGLQDLPEPDRVFIGGGGIHLESIIRSAARRLKPEGIMVINTVLVDNLATSLTVLKDLGFSAEITQIQVSRSKAMPWSQRLEAQHPVWIVTGSRASAESDVTQDCSTEHRPSSRYPVQFVGAGPGDPELITVKGQKALMQADRVIYAGSLVPEALLKWTRPEARSIDSSALNLEEIVDIMATEWQNGKRIVRLHTGDPSLYGAVFEQMAALDARNIPFAVIPGVTAAFAAAAAMGMEYTLPEITQTLILTRMAGRTPVPESENLKALADCQASMAIYLSISLIDKVQSILSEAYGQDAPCVIAYKVSHPEERIISTTLADLAETVRKEHITRHALVIVGKVLGITRDTLVHRSKLYDRDFTHGFRWKDLP